MLGALWGVVVAILLAIGAVLLWPIRILFRRRRKGTAKTTDETITETSEAHASEAGDAGDAEQSAHSS
jgi:cytoskeletal protein RodZ